MELSRMTPLFLLALILTLFACGEASEPASPPSASLDTAASDSVRYHGIDVSHHQGDVDWGAVKADSITFVFVKATEGNTYTDPKFMENWEAVKNAGLVRGAYHFFHPDDDALAQAEHFIATVRLEPGDLPPVLDIEVSEGVSTEGIDEDVQVWLEKVAETYGVNPIIYSGLHFIEANLSDGFEAYPLWLAEYTDSLPQPPGDWERWTFWQYADEDEIEGIVGTVDRSIHHGTEATWNYLLVPEER